MTKTITTPELAELLAGTKPVLIDFFATWCQPCKAMAPAIDEAAKRLEGIAEVVKIDIDESFDAAKLHGVRSVPTFIVLKGGARVAMKTGAMPAQAFVDWAAAQCGAAATAEA